MKYFLILSLLFSNHIMAARDIFKIQDLSVSTVKVEKLVQGELKASKLFVKYNGDTFQASDQSGTITAKVSILEKLFSAQSSFIKYTTNLEDDNPLISLDNLFLDNAQINFGKNEMTFEIPRAEIAIDNTTVETDKLSGLCDPLGDTSTDVDIVCLKNGELNMEKIKFVNESINMTASGFNATTTPEKISLRSSRAIFTSDGQRTQVNTFETSCKNGIDRRFNQNDLLKGCFISADVYLDGFSEFKNTKTKRNSYPNDKALVDLEDIKNLRLTIRNQVTNIRAKVKILFHFNLKVRGHIDYIREQDLLKLDIEKATIAGIPAKSLTIMLLKLFLEEDSITIEGDTIYIKF